MCFLLCIMLHGVLQKLWHFHSLLKMYSVSSKLARNLQRFFFGTWCGVLYVYVNVIDDGDGFAAICRRSRKLPSSCTERLTNDTRKISLILSSVRYLLTATSAAAKIKAVLYTTRGYSPQNSDRNCYYLFRSWILNVRGLKTDKKPQQTKWTENYPQMRLHYFFAEPWTASEKEFDFSAVFSDIGDAFHDLMHQNKNDFFSCKPAVAADIIFVRPVINKFHSCVTNCRFGGHSSQWGGRSTDDRSLVYSEYRCIISSPQGCPTSDLVTCCH